MSAGSISRLYLAYVSLYCGNTEKIAPKGSLLTGLNIGKGCIRFSETKDISKVAIKAFIKLASKR